MVVVSGGPKLLLDRRASAEAGQLSSRPTPRGQLTTSKDKRPAAASIGAGRRLDRRQRHRAKNEKIAKTPRTTERKSDEWSTLSSASAWIIRSSSATNGADIRKERVDQ